MLLFIVLIIQLNSFVSESMDIIINSETGNDSACLMTATTTPCSSLEYVAQALQGNLSNINIQIDGNLTLGPSEVIRFENASNLTISGRASEIQCHENISFLVRDVQNFKMELLKLDHCGWQTNESYYEAALFFEDSHDIKLIDIIISNTSSTGIVFRRCQGNVTIAGVRFYDNGEKKCQKYPTFSAGASIEITDMTEASYSLVNCEFTNNNVSYRHVPYNIGKINSSIHWIGTGLGGGLGIYFSGQSNGNFVEVKNCTFTNNTAVWGGGMYVHFQDNTYNNSVSIISSYFENNFAANAGGGADMGFLNNKSFHERTNVITFVKTTFESNFANYGGGVGVFSEYGDVKYKPKENIVFNECKWFNNRAVYSPAIDISPYYYSGSKRGGFLPLPLFSNVNITNNYIRNKTYHTYPERTGDAKTTLHINSGVFVITQFTVYFSGHISFTRNEYSALHLTSATMIIDENTTMNFSGNVGAEGGAIAMYAFSYITINKNTHIEFVHNHADTLGGAIYHHTIDQNDFITGSTCFIEYNDSVKESKPENVTFHFNNNNAGVGGVSIYADTFGNCHHRCVKRPVKIYVSYRHVPYNIIRKINSSIHWIGTGLGGGLGIYFSGHSNGNFVEVQNCTFTNNTAVWGGGMYVHFQDNTYNNSVSIISSYFENNFAANAGGGADAGFLNNESFQERTTVITFVKTTFESNFANYGGGVGVFSEYSDVKYKPKENIVFNECKWFNNRAVYSPAIDISPYYYSGSKRGGFLPLPLFSNVNITNNYIRNKTYHTYPERTGDAKTTLHINSGVFVITQFTVYFSGHISFTRNEYSALHLTSATMIIDENTTMNFSGNVGAEGGAIAMYAFSYITINKNTHIEFVHNHADTLGGAIYHHTIDQNDFITGSTCFIEYNDSVKESKPENVTFHFNNNNAGVGGVSIYADTFGNCHHRCVKRPVKNGILNVHYITKCIGNFTYSDELNDCNNFGFASSAARFVFGNPNQLKYSVIPGSVLNISFDIKDEFNRTAHPLMSVSVENSSNSIRIARQSKYTILTNFTPLGRPGDSIFVDFTAHGTRGIFFHFDIEMQQCPPGFYFDEEKELCQCSANSHHKKYAPITRCDMGNFSAYMKGKYWVGYIPETQNYSNLYFAPCFFPLCNITSFYLPNVTSELTSSICAENRHGIMCGKCAANHSVFYHSKYYKCSPNHLCHLGIHFLSLI